MAQSIPTLDRSTWLRGGCKLRKGRWRNERDDKKPFPETRTDGNEERRRGLVGELKTRGRVSGDREWEEQMTALQEEREGEQRKEEKGENGCDETLSLEID